MPFGTQKAFQRLALPKPEILMYPLETTVIDSAVINATGVVADVSGPYVGRRYLVAGTILPSVETLSTRRSPGPARSAGFSTTLSSSLTALTPATSQWRSSAAMSALTS